MYLFVRVDWFRECMHVQARTLVHAQIVMIFMGFETEKMTAGCVVREDPLPTRVIVWILDLWFWLDAPSPKHKNEHVVGVA